MPKNINEILDRASGLKHNFYTAMKVSKMLDDFNVSINDLSKVISLDPALTATILKHCNSAQYGFARKITNIHDAISIIGFKTLKTIIFTIVSKSSFNREVKGYRLADGELWKNSISCAVYARYIANVTGYEDPDQAFTAALLRDIGKLVLQEYVNEEYKNIMGLIENENISFSEAEEKIIGFSHAYIGAVLAEKWNFPPVLTDAIKYHHHPEIAEENNCEDMNLIRIIHLSDYLTVNLGYGIGLDGMMHETDVTCLEKLGFEKSHERLERLISDVINLNSEINSLVSSV